jgi:type IV pilus assembly protein PilB
MARKKLGEMLVDAGVLSESGLKMALQEQRRWGGTLGRTVVEMKLVSESELVRVLAQQLSLPTVDLDHQEIHPTVLELVPAELAEQHNLVPFAQPMKFLDVAMADPTNLGVIDELRIRTQLNIRPYLAGPKMLERAISKHYGKGFGYVHRPEIAIPIETTGDVVDSAAASQPIPSSERVRPRTMPRPPTPVLDPFGDDSSGPMPGATRDAEIDALQGRISTLEALVARDEAVLRKLLALLVEKGVASRDEILERLK